MIEDKRHADQVTSGSGGRTEEAQDRRSELGELAERDSDGGEGNASLPAL